MIQSYHTNLGGGVMKQNFCMGVCLLRKVGGGMVGSKMTEVLLRPMHLGSVRGGAQGIVGPRRSNRRIRPARESRGLRVIVVAAAAAPAAVVPTGSGPPLPQKVSGALVYPADGPVKGICHFLGGAFACAAPQVVYPLMINSLVASGYTVIATPFAITFKHKECAIKLHKEFWKSLEDIRSSDLAYCVPDDAPIHGIGHSMGALMHLLIGAFGEGPQPNSNIIIAVNNKELSDAVPIPGLFESLQASMMAVNNAPFNPFPDPLPLLRDLTAAALGSTANAPIKELFVPSVAPAFDQIESVLDELKQGVRGFIPTPLESRAIIQEKYNVPSTLMIRFTDDGIDETPDIKGYLKSRKQAYVSEQLVEGNHLTPIGGDLKWLGLEVPDDLTTQINDPVLKGNAKLVEEVLQWMDSFAGVVDEVPSM